MRHCRTEFRKQVFPTLYKPAPILREQVQSITRSEGSNRGGVGGLGADFDWRDPLGTVDLVSSRRSRPREER